jgi:hypothetical protein
MTARSPQHEGAGWFTTPAQVNHRRYEALRAFFVDGLTYQQAADRFGYTRWVMSKREARSSSHGTRFRGRHRGATRGRRRDPTSPTSTLAGRDGLRLDGPASTTRTRPRLVRARLRPGREDGRAATGDDTVDAEWPVRLRPPLLPIQSRYRRAYYQIHRPAAR